MDAAKIDMLIVQKRSRNVNYFNTFGQYPANIANVALLCKQQAGPVGPAWVIAVY
jgi:hypothetical protein